LTLLLCALALLAPQEAAANRKSLSEAERTGLPALQIYQVREGKMVQRLIRPDRAASEGRLEIEGYVSLIVAVGRPDLSIRVDGAPMKPVRSDASGQVSLGYYGTIDPKQVLARGMPPSKGRTSETPAVGSESPSVYTFFPAVPADTISRKQDFAIEIASRKGLLARLRIRHQATPEPRNVLSGGSCRFGFVGTAPAPGTPAGISGKRLRAVSEGVDFIETAFETDLVESVRVIGYDEIHNAVTFPDRTDIWFYRRALAEEPVDELKVIAAHEALHILVDALDLTESSALRHLFADLKGFSDFSAERFHVLARGVTPAAARLDKGEDGFFFDFISERNFLEEMKGGHPEENLDEFCTSFLHTLLYPQRLAALLGPGRQDASGSRAYSSSERRRALDYYHHMLESLIQWTADQAGGSEAGYAEAAQRLFRDRLALVEAAGAAAGHVRTAMHEDRRLRQKRMHQPVE
jgi:hypothetical protein